jgi:hypothetical protein
VLWCLFLFFLKRRLPEIGIEVKKNNRKKPEVPETDFVFLGSKAIDNLKLLSD